MKRLLLTILVLLAASMAVCILSMKNVHRVCDHARHLCSEAILHMDAGDIQKVEQTLVELAVFLDKNEGWLEIVCDHNDLHTIKGELIDAQASIEFGIEDDFYQAISRFGEGLEHIAAIEEFNLRNLC